MAPDGALGASVVVAVAVVVVGVAVGVVVWVVAVAAAVVRYLEKEVDAGAAHLAGLAAPIGVNPNPPTDRTMIEAAMGANKPARCAAPHPRPSLNIFP